MRPASPAGRRRCIATTSTSGPPRPAPAWCCPHAPPPPCRAGSEARGRGAQVGQRAEGMLNNLDGLEARLAPASRDGPCFRVEGGYTLADERGLRRLQVAPARGRGGRE